MNEWKETTLDEILIIEMGLSPKGDTCNTKKIGLPLLNGPTEFGRKNPTPVQFTTDARKVAQKGDLLFCVRGSTTGKMNWSDQKYAIGRGIAAIRHNQGDELYSFAKALIDFNLPVLLSSSTGSTFPNVSKNQLEKLEIFLPPLPEQHAIAEVLSSLDDKIDLLHRQNQTLEQMAETLFRQWFVEEADESWEEGVLGDLIVAKYGKDHKKLADGNIPVYGSGGIMRYAESALYSSETVLIPRKGSLNNIIYLNEPFWSVDTMFYTEMKKSNLAKFIYFFLKNKNLASMNVGSAVPSMTTSILNNMSLEIAPNSVFEKFETIVKPCFKKIKSNQNQIRTLEKLRDTLLPKLMSGEVRISINE